MDKETITRAALGNIASFGSLYDARSDKFCGLSLFKRKIPSQTITLTDSNFSDIRLIHSDNISEKFRKFNVQSELQISVLSGLFSVDGSAQYLRDRKKSARTVKSSLLYNIKTKDENVNVFHEDLRECFATHPIEADVATHVVTGISWGASVVLSCFCENKENRNVRDIESELSSSLKIFKSSISSKRSIGLGQAGVQFEIQIFGDILPSDEELPTTTQGALELMKRLPSLVATCNDGKGKPLGYTMIPLGILQNYLQFKVKGYTMLRSLEEASLLRVIKLFEEMAKIQQKLHDIYQDAIDYHCVEEADLRKIKRLKQESNIQETIFRSKLASTLVKVRSSEGDMHSIENLLKEFHGSEFSPEMLSSEMRAWSEIRERVNFARNLARHGVIYIGLDMSLEDELFKRFNSKSVIFYFTRKSQVQEQKDSIQRLGKNRRLFFQEIMKSNEDSNEDLKVCYFAVDCDIHPKYLTEMSSSSRVQVIQSGHVLSDDLLADKESSEAISLARCASANVMKILEKPSSRIKLQIPCTGINCNPAPRYTWTCEKCLAHLEYGFDGYLYCGCGKCPPSLVEFKCTDKRHALFERHDEKYLKLVLGSLRRFEEINVLIVGDNKQVNSRWIKFFSNLARYDKPEDVDIDDLNLGEEDGVSKDINDNEIATFENQSEAATPEIHEIHEPGLQTLRLIQMSVSPYFSEKSSSLDKRQILESIHTATQRSGELQAICMFPSVENRLTLQRFIQELVPLLGATSAENLIFCVKPQSSANKQNFEIPGVVRSPKTHFSFDLELSSNLYKMSSGDKVGMKRLSKDWKSSKEELTRMLNHIKQLPAIKMKPNTNNKNLKSNNGEYTGKYVKSVLFVLTQISIEIFHFLIAKQGAMKGREKWFRRMIRKTNEDDHVPLWKFLKEELWSVEMRIFKEMFRAEGNVHDEYKRELSNILRNSLRLASYLRSSKGEGNPYENWMDDYLEKLIRGEKNPNLKSSLKTWRDWYSVERGAAHKFGMVVTSEEIETVLEELSSLRYFGCSIAQGLNFVMEVLEESETRHGNSSSYPLREPWLSAHVAALANPSPFGGSGGRQDETDGRQRPRGLSFAEIPD